MSVRSDAQHRQHERASARVDLWFALLLTLAALAVRWPHLLTAPAWTDEVEEILLSLAVARGEVWPLTNVSAYLGPLHAYLLAGLLMVSGPGLVWPRLLVWLLGGLTVAFTYLLGRLEGGRGVALLAALLLAVSPVHVLVNSHIAWQHSTAPFWFTLTLVLLARARAGGGGWLIAAGAVAGLAAQVHPVVALTLPGVLAGWSRAARGERTQRAALVALLAGLLMISPLLWANLTSGLSGLRDAEQRPYAYALGAGPAVYLDSLARLLVALPRAAAGAFSEGLPLLTALVEPEALAATWLLLAGLAWGLRRRQWPLLGAVLAALLLLPAINRDYLLPLQGRYIAHLLPVLAVLAAGALGSGWRWGSRLLLDPGIDAQAIRRPLLGVLLLAGVAGLTLAAVMRPLAVVLDYQRQLEAVGVGNEVVLALTGVLRSDRDRAEVALDARLASQRMPGNSRLDRALLAALALEHIPVAPATLTEMTPAKLLPGPGAVRYLLLAPGMMPPPVAGHDWRRCLSFPERTRLGLFTAELYRLETVSPSASQDERPSQGQSEGCHAPGG